MISLMNNYKQTSSERNVIPDIRTYRNKNENYKSHKNKNS